VHSYLYFFGVPGDCFLSTEDSALFLFEAVLFLAAFKDDLLPLAVEVAWVEVARQ
jgi:hypothetical protein